MKSLRLTLNQSNSVIVNSKDTDNLSMSIKFEGDGIQLTLTNMQEKNDSLVEKMWFKHTLAPNDQLSIDSIEAEASVEPLTTKTYGPFKPSCSFCSKRQDKVNCLIKGKWPLVYICDECISVCADSVKVFNVRKQKSPDDSKA